MIADDSMAAIRQYLTTLFSDSTELLIERAEEGVSTIVYRVRTGDQTYYLRVGPDAGISLAAEVAVHQQLVALGLHVPHVLQFEPCHPGLQRSLVLTSMIAGRAIGYGQLPAGINQILYQAGCELAYLNQLPVQGYGWVTKYTAELGLLAEHSTPSAWLIAHFAEPLWAVAQSAAVSPQEAQQILLLLEHACIQFADQPAVLAHGDFDPTHIYYQDEIYSGMIDFGEIRGAPWFYDLSHFAMESSQLFPALLAGYQLVRPLTALDHDTILLTSILIAARRVGRCLLQQRSPHPPDIIYIARMLAPFH